MRKGKAFKIVVEKYDVALWGDDIFLVSKRNDFKTMIKVSFVGGIGFVIHGDTTDVNEMKQQKVSVKILNKTVTFRRLKKYLKKFGTYIVRF